MIHGCNVQKTRCSVQVLAGRPHKAPLFSGTEPGSRTIFGRVLSCPSMLAAQAGDRTGDDTSSARKRPYECVTSSEEAHPESPTATNDDSGNSTATAADAVCATKDASPFAAFCKLSGCATCLPQGFLVLCISGMSILQGLTRTWMRSEMCLGALEEVLTGFIETPMLFTCDRQWSSLLSQIRGLRCEGPAVTSPVQLKITPLDLTPWPSTSSSVSRLGSMGRQGSLAPQLPAIREHTQEQVS